MTNVDQLHDAYDTNKDKLIDPNELSKIDADLQDADSDDMIDKVFNDPQLLNDLTSLLEKSSSLAPVDDKDKYCELITKIETKKIQKTEQEKKDKFVGPLPSIDILKSQEIPNNSLESIVNSFDNNTLEMLQELQSGKVDVKNIDNLSSAMNFLSFLDKSGDRAQTIDDFTVQLQKKIEAISDPAQKTKSQELLTALQPMLKDLKDKNSILSITASKLSGSIDTHLNGSPYDKLLADASDIKNLDSANAKKAMARIFLRDEQSFNTLIADASDATKKPQVDNIVRKYAELEGKSIPEGSAIAVVYLKDKDGKNTGKKGFEYKNDKGDLVVIEFGNKGVPQKFGDILGKPGKEWLQGKEKGMFDIVDGKMMIGAVLVGAMGVEGTVAKLVTGKTFASMSDALGAFFESPMFDEIKKMFLMLSMFGKEGMSSESQTEIGFIDAKKAILAKMQNDTEGKKELSNKFKNFKRNQLMGSNEKKSNSADGTQKDYFVNYLTMKNQIKYIKGEKIVGQEEYVQPVDSKVLEKRQQDKGKVAKVNNTEKTNPDVETSFVGVENNNSSKELVSGQEYPELKINNTDANLKGKLEIDFSDPSKKYALVDGQVVNLALSPDKKTASGVLYTQSPDKKGFVESTIQLDVATQKISLVQGKETISTDLQDAKVKSVYENGKLKLPIAQGNETLFNYFAFSKSIDPTKPNAIDGVHNTLSKDFTQLGIFQKKFVDLQTRYTALSPKDGTTISKLIDEMKSSDLKLADPKQQNVLVTALDNWKKIFVEAKLTIAQDPVVISKKKI